MYEDTIKHFEKNGFAVIKDFLSYEEVDLLLKECSNIVETMEPSENSSVFVTGENQVGDEYFLNSGDKISFFFEKDAVSEDGKLIVDKKRSLNKIGHALHWLSPVYKKITFGNTVKNLLKEFKYTDPVVVQSMFIFKHPVIGGKVVNHQDSTFVYTEPQTVLGLWFPLVDVNETNGCLWFLPGSHKGPLYQRFVRNPTGDSLLILNGEIPPLDNTQFIPLTASKGDCIVIHGSVIHNSGLNNSMEPRSVYSFHIIEQENTSYSSENWLQPSEILPFPSIYLVNELENV